MKKPLSIQIAILAFTFLALMAVLPVSGEVMASETFTVTAQSVNATVSAGRVVAGEPVTISGTVTGSMISAGVQIWVFAGNYVNVTTVPVNADGTFSRTYNSAGLPTATYYVFVQSPGPNGNYNIDLQESGVYSGQVVNTRTNELIFNFTGAGSVNDAAAAEALSDAINQQGIDDAYTKLTFILADVPVSPQATVQTTAGVPQPTTTTKSPLLMEITLLALAIAGMGAVSFSGKFR